MKPLMILLATGFSCAAFAQGAFQIGVDVKGAARLSKDAGPVYVEFAGSKSATTAVIENLRRGGYAIATERGRASQSLLLNGIYSAQSSTGKKHAENIVVVIEAQKVKPTVPPHDTGVNALPPPASDGSKMPAAAGSPVFGDLGDQARGYAAKMAAAGIGASAAKCPMEGCKTPELVKQSAQITIVVESQAGIERAEVAASATAEAIIADLLIARAANVSMDMVKGPK